MDQAHFSAGRVAVITGAARGIGRAVALKCAARGMKLVLADVIADELATVAAAAKAMGAPEALAVLTDVADMSAVNQLAEVAYQQFGAVHFLMNNAAIGDGGGTFENYDNWQRLMGVNMWGVINGVQAFVPRMIASGESGLVVNTGSKQGITCPPGNAAYNASKAAVKVVTEQLAHELRSAAPGRIATHLLIPGWTFTGINGSRLDAERPAGAWTAAQVADFMFEGIARGDFYILCPDNETPRELDEKRMAWAIGDIIENRPALSRWHPDYKDAFADFLKT